jgi:ATP-binding cassette subfamily B protein
VSAGEIRLEGVTFRHNAQRHVLRDVTLTIPGGSLCAFVGPSGAGKSTIFRLLFRFFDVEAGRVLVDGQDIRGVTLESLRRHVAAIPQDTVLLNDTARYNIEYGRPGAGTAAVEAAARAAHIGESASCAHLFVGFPGQEVKSAVLPV